MKIYRRVKGLPEPVDTTGFTKSEKVAESVTFNDDGSYSSTISGPVDDFWDKKDINENIPEKESDNAEDVEEEKNGISEDNKDSSTENNSSTDNSSEDNNSSIDDNSSTDNNLSTDKLQ